MQIIRAIVDQQWNGKRVDLFIVSLPDTQGISRTALQKQKKNGYLSVNGAICGDPSHLVKENDVIDLDYHQLVRIIPLQPADIELDIVFENEYLAVINKPANLSTHPGAGNRDNTLVNALINHYGLQGLCKQETDRPGIVHRLDKDTSGLMLIAKTDAAYLSLSKQISEKSCVRQYLGVCYGILVPSIGTVETYLRPSQKDYRYYENASHISVNAKLAITNYKTLEIFLQGAISLVQLQLETGRTHQIRAHLMHKHHPLVGEKVYTKPSYIALPDATEKSVRKLLHGFPRQALHSFYISFHDPLTDVIMEFERHLPQDIEYLLSAIRQ